MKKLALLITILVSLSLTSCGIYSFTGANTEGLETFQVNYFPNNADLVEPGIERQFRLDLQDLIQSQTNLILTDNNADLIFEGEITDYYFAPMTATADSNAAQTRLKIIVQVQFYNTKDPEKNFDRSFSFYYDYDALSQLTGSDLDAAIDEIYDRITQDIFNAALNDW